MFWILFALSAGALFVAVLGYWESHKRRTQMQNDPRVARVWLAGITFGKEHILTRGSTLQGWLNDHNITFLGNHEVIQSQFSGDPGAVELWFNYESYLIGHPDLECHRLTPSGTAFTDDLGQPYHGYLDIHGKTIGVYLPGYDHAAKRLYCMLHWVPRQPAPPLPVSNPMVFTIDLPPVKRILSSSADLPRDPVTQTKGGITVTASAARLGVPKLGSQATGQRDLTFRLKIDGGHLADDNVADDLSSDDIEDLTSAETGLSRAIPPQTVRTLQSRLNRQVWITQQISKPPGTTRTIIQPMPIVATPSSDSMLTITDPYGVSLLVPQQSVTPLVTRETVQSARKGEGTVWVAPLNGAGRGTDVIKLHFDVVPNPHGKGGAPVRSIPFDLLLPVQTGDEI